MLKHLITCLTILLIITGCKKNKQEEAIVLRVVTSADQAPFEFFNSHTSAVEGFDIDLAKEIGKRLNMEVIITDMDFGGILPSLQSGQADMAIAGITRTVEREKNLDFSNDYYQPKLGIISLISFPIRNTEDFKERRIGAQLGTFHQILLSDILQSGVFMEIVARNRLLDLVQELLSMNIHAVLMDYIPATKFVRSHSNKLMVTEFVHSNAKAYAIAFPKNSELKEKVNSVLEGLKKEGFIKSLEEKWLNTDIEYSK